MKKLELLFLISVLIALLFLTCTKRDSTGPGDGNAGSRFIDLEGHISGTLDNVYAIYRIADNLYVDSRDSLVIEPGVELRFADSARFIINGTLRAIGEKQNFIMFTALGTHWKGIQIRNSPGSSIVQYAVIENVTIDAEDSLEFGAVEIHNSDVTIRNCVIRNNHSVQGGGLSVVESEARIENTIFRDNYAEVFGGALISYQSTAHIINNTIYKNYSFNNGGGVVLFQPDNDTLQNNIFYKNASNLGDPRISVIPSSAGAYESAYNFLSVNDPDPQFRSDADLRLSPDSPCIDNGNPHPIYDDPDGTRNDQGAFGGPFGDWYGYYPIAVGDSRTN